ncbi:MAG: ABC transporter permease subunit [Longimicrobiales bacterium]|nr:ABC transporter permease subunit [Longimicrobiales bacterium]
MSLPAAVPGTHAAAPSGDRPTGRRRFPGPAPATLLFWALAVWTLLPLAVLAVVAWSGGWRFPTLLGASPGTPPWSQLAGGWGPLAGALGMSLALAVGTGVLAGAGGLPLGRALAGLGGRWRAVGAGAAFLPVAAPPLALGVGLQFTFLRLGLGGSTLGVLLAHLVPALGYTTLYFLGVFAVFDEEIEEEARRLGARPHQVLVRVTLPLLRRPLAEAAILGFLVSWAQVPLTLLVGQARVRTLTVEVLAWTQAGQDPLAAAGALCLALPPLALMAAAALAVRRGEVVIP